jgi:hypothetical protein
MVTDPTADLEPDEDFDGSTGDAKPNQSSTCSPTARRESQCWTGVGHDYGDGVDHANYKLTFPFTGTVERVTFDITGDAVKNAEAQTRKAMSHQ